MRVLDKIERAHGAQTKVAQGWLPRLFASKKEVPPTPKIDPEAIRRLGASSGTGAAASVAAKERKISLLASSAKPEDRVRAATLQKAPLTLQSVQDAAEVAAKKALEQQNALTAAKAKAADRLRRITTAKKQHADLMRTPVSERKNKGVGGEESPHVVALNKARQGLRTIGQPLTEFGGEKNPFRGISSLVGGDPGDNRAAEIAGGTAAAGVGGGALALKMRSAARARAAQAVPAATGGLGAALLQRLAARR